MRLAATEIVGEIFVSTSGKYHLYNNTNNTYTNVY